MKDFDKAHYKGTLVALCRTLSTYNAFAQGLVTKETGRDILAY